MSLEKLKSITSGWKNFIFRTPEIEELANVRAQICSRCDFSDPEYPFKVFIPERLKNKEPLPIIKGMGCTKCGCPLSSKLRSVKEKCPEGKW
jgi:ribosomal protein L37E